jgi:hypothetical protein
MEFASTQRKSTNTFLNERSSRSHYLYRIEVTRIEEGNAKVSLINVIDLAGSENVNKVLEGSGISSFEETPNTMKSGERMSLRKETGNINKSLTTLG